MATFGERVEGLTSLSITDTSAPTQEQVTEFLRDGATEVRNKHLINKPKDVHLFSSESEELASNPLNLDGAQIIDVVRESGTNNDWRRCRFADEKTETFSQHSASVQDINFDFAFSYWDINDGQEMITGEHEMLYKPLIENTWMWQLVPNMNVGANVLEKR